MWWLIIFILILSPFFYLLFAPVVIEIDSTINVYRLGWKKILTITLLLDDNEIQLQIKTGRWKWTWDLQQATGTDKPAIETSKKKTKPARKKTSRAFPKVVKIKGVIRSFRIKKCYITVDTGNMPLNGILFPWFYLLSVYTENTIMINFKNEQVIILQIENTLARMLWAYIKS